MWEQETSKKATFSEVNSPPMLTFLPINDRCQISDLELCYNEISITNCNIENLLMENLGVYDVFTPNLINFLLLSNFIFESNGLSKEFNSNHTKHFIYQGICMLITLPQRKIICFLGLDSKIINIKSL